MMHGILSVRLEKNEKKNNIVIGIGKWMPSYIVGESVSWCSSLQRAVWQYLLNVKCIIFWPSKLTCYSKIF